jgi:omega-6 fatty acid desaturase (delta-12 desaturase)
LTTQPAAGALCDALAQYQRPSPGRSVGEIIVSALPFAVFWGAAFFCVNRGWWWGLLLIAPAAAFLVRLFMIQHDCGHSAFFRTRQANTWVGRAIGLLTMTPYGYWQHTHAVHHATSGNLDRRGLGAVEMLTVAEYRGLSRLRRWAYRLYRHPAVMFGLGPFYLFILQQRLPIGLMKEKKAWLSVLGNNLGIALFVVGLTLLGGLRAFLLVQLPIVALAGSVGVWLFYVQHQFEGAYWKRNGAWVLADASLRGSSQLVMPPILRWFTANIGAHHVHHLGSKIPFYRLPQVLKDQPDLDAMGRVTLRQAFRAIRLGLWDEASERLVSFRHAAQAVSAA